MVKKAFFLLLFLGIPLSSCMTLNIKIGPPPQPATPTLTDVTAQPSATTLPPPSPAPSATAVAQVAPVRAIITLKNADRLVELAPLKTKLVNVYQLAWYPDGRFIAVGGEDGIVLYDAWTDAQVMFFDSGVNFWASTMVLSPDGQFLVTVKDYFSPKYDIWRIAPGQGSGLFGNSPVSAITGRMRLLRGNAFGGSMMVEPGGGTPAGGDGDIRTLAFRADGILAVAYESGNVGLIDILKGRSNQTIYTGFTGGYSISSMAFSPDGEKLVIGLTNHQVRLFDVKTGNLIAILDDKYVPVQCCSFRLAYSPDGSMIAAGRHDGTIRVWDGRTGKLLRSLGRKDSRWVSSLAFSPDSNVLAAVHVDGTLVLWNPREGTVLFENVARMHSMDAFLVFSPDGRTINVATAVYPSLLEPASVSRWGINIP